jgi:hypothetical protein
LTPALAIYSVDPLLHPGVSRGSAVPVVFFEGGHVRDPNQRVDFRRLATTAGVGPSIDARRGSEKALFRL